MKFISTKGMTNENAPNEKVLVQYLEPSWGGFNVEFAIGYFDNPNDYTDGDGYGWKHWTTDNKINVLAYCELPETIKTKFSQMKQTDFLEKFGTYNPNLGCIGE